MTAPEPVVLGAAVLERLARRPLRFVALLGLGFGSLCVAKEARADVSSWASVASGPTWLDDGNNQRSVVSLQMNAGIGLPPSGPLVVGGLFDVTTHFGQGTDLGLLSRFATRGFVLGDWGGAIDLGAYERLWGRGSAGFLGKLVLGAPWGLQLGLGGGIGSKEAKFFGVTLGIDFARLTVFRTTGESWFPNPYPAYRKVD